MRRSGPRPIADAVAGVLRAAQPATPLAHLQAAWEAVGERNARHSRPVAERGGVVTVECSDAQWANELALLELDVRAQLSAALEARGTPIQVRSLRFVVRG